MFPSINFNKNYVFIIMNKLYFLTGIIGPVVTLSLIFLDISISPYFSWHVNSLSSLGIHKYYYLFDSAVIFEGLMNTAFSVFLYRAVPVKPLPIILMIIGSIGLFFVGIFNEHTGDIHLTFAILYFILMPLGIIIFSLFRISRFITLYGMISALISLMVIIIGILMALKIIKLKGVGLSIPETIEALLLASWIIMLASYIIFNYSKLQTNKIILA